MRERAPWKEVRAKYESGEGSYRQLAEEYGVSRTTVLRHARLERWISQKRNSKARQRDRMERMRETAEVLLEATKLKLKQEGYEGLEIKELKELAGILHTLAGLEKTLCDGAAESAPRETTVRVVMDKEVEELSR
mgnify:CR=1 FL=1